LASQVGRNLAAGEPPVAGILHTDVRPRNDAFRIEKGDALARRGPRRPAPDARLHDGAPVIVERRERMQRVSRVAGEDIRIL
jgi:hypothetical protein